MAKITVQGWKHGLNKVGFTKLLQNEAGYTLSEAKHFTDDLLAGRTLTVNVPEELRASLVRQMEDLGAVPNPDDLRESKHLMSGSR